MLRQPLAQLMADFRIRTPPYVLYIAVALVLTGIVDYPKLKVANPIDIGIQATGFTWLRPIVNIGALARMFSVILVNLLAQPRVFDSMARDGLLPAWAGGSIRDSAHHTSPRSSPLRAARSPRRHCRWVFLASSRAWGR